MSSSSNVTELLFNDAVGRRSELSLDIVLHVGCDTAIAYVALIGARQSSPRPSWTRAFPLGDTNAELCPLWHLPQCENGREAVFSKWKWTFDGSIDLSV